MYRDYLTCMESEHKTYCGFNPAKKAKNMLDSVSSLGTLGTSGHQMEGSVLRLATTKE